MKFFKRVLLSIGIIVVCVGIFIGVSFRPIALPEKGNAIFESEPTINAFRVAKEINGVEGCRFFIQSPKAEALESISVADFGASPDNPDNSKALNRAFEYCKEYYEQKNRGIRLVFEKGVYYVADELRITGLHDVCIDGNGAKILYDYGGGLLNIYESECLEIRNLTFDWDWDKKPLGALARALDVPGEFNTVDFVFDVPAYAREDMLYAITQCDEETNTYGAKGTLIETYEGQNPDVIKKVTKIGADTLRVVHNGALARFSGHKFILRSNAYGGSLIRIDNGCCNVTLENLNLYGGNGMGIIVGGRSSHFALRNIFIGPDPEYADVRCTSLDADAVHINDADGCFVIENCDFSRQGDDDVNINSGIGIIRSINGRTVTVSSDGSMDTDPGDVIAFRDKNFGMTDLTAVVEKSESAGYKLRTITFRDDLPAAIKEGYMLFNKDCTGGNYVIRNNYFHEHRARGLLLQTPNGLIENNTFYKTSHDAIRIVMDITTGEWNEGTGADNIVIRNNKFIECGVIGTEVIEIGTHIDGKTSRAYDAFTNIRIENNEFRDVCGNLIFANNVNNLTFNNNVITLGEKFPANVGKGRCYFMRNCANIDLTNNTYTDVRPLSFARIIRSNSPFLWLRLNVEVQRNKGGEQ